jgi:hypothetical protein
MSKVWTEKLLSSQVKFMNDIIEQVPEDHGAREAFVNCLQALADSPSDLKFRYIMCVEDVTGTNDLEKARKCASYEDTFVIDVVEAKWLCDDDEDDDEDIEEAR